MQTSRFTPLRFLALLAALVALAAAPAWAADDDDPTDPGGGGGGGDLVPVPTIQSGPSAGVTIGTRTPTFTFNGGSAYECSIATPASYTSCNSGSYTPSPPLADGEHTFRVRAVDGSATSVAVARTFSVDATGPAISWSAFSVLGGRVNGGSFGYFSSDPTASFSCQINSSSWIPCGSGYSLPGALSASLVQGATNIFRVRAQDQLGNIGGTLSRSFTWDTIAPDTSITPIANPVTTRRPQISYDAPVTSGDSHSYFCTLIIEGTPTPQAPCGSGTSGGSWQPPADLADGSYVLRVSARDIALNVETTPAELPFTIDATAPAIAFADGSASGTVTTPTPTFAMTSDDPDADFLCRIGSGAYEPCASPYTTPALANGPHVINVKAVDDAGNQSNVLTRLVTVAVPAARQTTDTGGTQTPTTTQTAGGGGTQEVAGDRENVVQCVVPKLKGKKLRAARKALVKANCATGKVKKRRAAKRKRGRVLKQPKKAGTTLPAGTKIRLVVGR
jgi:hypothetical protein